MRACATPSSLFPEHVPVHHHSFCLSFVHTLPTFSFGSSMHSCIHPFLRHFFVFRIPSALNHPERINNSSLKFQHFGTNAISSSRTCASGPIRCIVDGCSGQFWLSWTEGVRFRINSGFIPASCWLYCSIDVPICFSQCERRSEGLQRRFLRSIILIQAVHAARSTRHTPLPGDPGKSVHKGTLPQTSAARDAQWKQHGSLPGRHKK